MADWKLWRQKIKNICIKNKLIIFLMVSIAAICMLYGSTWILTRNTLLNNSRDSLINLSAQIMVNLDTKVRGIESATDRIKDALQALQLESADSKISQFEYREKNQSFCDNVIMQEEIYANVSTVVYRNLQGMEFRFDKIGVEEESYDNVISEAENKLTTTTPYLWTEYDNKKVFIRMLIDNQRLKCMGYICLVLEEDFFDFVEVENSIISNRDFIIMDRRRTIMVNQIFDTSDEQLRKLMRKPDTGGSFSILTTMTNKKYLILGADSQQTGWRFLLLVPISRILQQQRQTMEYLMIIAVIILSVLSGISLWIMKTIIRNITILRDGMDLFETHGKALRLKPYNYDEVGMMIPRFNYMTMRIQQLTEHVIEEKKNKEEAEFHALQAKINPHFLYNTLGSIKWMAHREGKTYIEQMLDSLIYILRFSVKRTDTFISMKEEIEYISQYLKLQEMRFGDVYQVKIHITKEAEKAKILGFILQPIVENALYHGINMEEGNGCILISAEKVKGELQVSIKDNGKGMTQEQINKVLNEKKEYKGFNSIGIQMIATRLNSSYPGTPFTIESEPGKGTIVNIRIPYEVYKNV